MWPLSTPMIVSRPERVPSALTANTGNPIAPSARYSPVEATPRRAPNSAPTNSTENVWRVTGTYGLAGTYRLPSAIAGRSNEIQAPRTMSSVPPMTSSRLRCQAAARSPSRIGTRKSPRVSPRSSGGTRLSRAAITPLMLPAASDDRSPAATPGPGRFARSWRCRCPGGGNVTRFSVASPLDRARQDAAHEVPLETQEHDQRQHHGHERARGQDVPCTAPRAHHLAETERHGCQLGAGTQEHE